MFRLSFSVFTAMLCAMSSAAMAAEVVDMRLGRHPAYTRVVFELDAPAGYSLEQSIGATGETELVVTLDARGQDQSKTLPQSLVSGVTLESAGSRSVARIRIPKSGLRVKEMILGGPPRIVLDVLAPIAPKTKTAAAPAPKAPAATSKPVAKAAPAARTPAPTPPASIADAAPPAPTRVATRPKATPGPAAKRPTQPKAPAKAATPVAKPAAKPAPVPAAKVAKAPAAKQAPAAKSTPAKTPPPPARKKPASIPAAPAAAPAPSNDGLFTPTNLGGGLALLALVGGGTWFMLKRRGGTELITEEDLQDDPMSADNPFATLGDDFSVPAGAETDAAEATAEVSFGESEDELPEANVVDEFASDDGDAGDEGEAVMASTAVASEPQADLFDTAVTEAIPAADDTDKPGDEGVGAMGDDMEAYGDTVDAGMESMPPMGASAGASDDVMRMLREFEQRVASLEGRLDEVSEAKERLERQVAAQTEELRVQRAAIARTQRALRNLSRPDDESPTEPALRGDPNA